MRAVKRLCTYLSHPGMRNSASVAITKGTTMAVRTGLLLWVADAAGPRVFGRLALCVATTELLRIACDFGTQTLFVRRFAQFRLLEEGQKQLIALARFRAVATAVGVGLYLGIVGAVFGATLGRIELLTCALLVTALAISFPLTFFQAKLEVHKAIGPVLGCAVLYIGYFATSYGHSIFTMVENLRGLRVWQRAKPPHDTGTLPASNEGDHI